VSTPIQTPEDNDSSSKSVLGEEEVPESDVLVRLKLVNSAYVREVEARDAETKQAIEAIHHKYSSIIAEALSVMYQVVAEAHREGFTEAQVAEYLYVGEEEDTPPHEN
jgi:hypothetical protein